MSQINKPNKVLQSNSNDDAATPSANNTNSEKTSGDSKKITALIEPNSKEKKKRTALYTENLPTFYVGQGNNSEL